MAKHFQWMVWVLLITPKIWAEPPQINPYSVTLIEEEPYLAEIRADVRRANRYRLLKNISFGLYGTGIGAMVFATADRAWDLHLLAPHLVTAFMSKPFVGLLTAQGVLSFVLEKSNSHHTAALEKKLSNLPPKDYFRMDSDSVRKASEVSAKCAETLQKLEKQRP